MNCIVKGFPKPEVNWTKDGKLLHTTNKLTIKQVTYGDTGQYTCSAKNSEGKMLIYFFSSSYSFHFLFFFSNFSSFWTVLVNSMPRSS